MSVQLSVLMPEQTKVDRIPLLVHHHRTLTGRAQVSDWATAARNSMSGIQSSRRTTTSLCLFLYLGMLRCNSVGTGHVHTEHGGSLRSVFKVPPRYQC